MVSVIAECIKHKFNHKFNNTLGSFKHKISKSITLMTHREMLQYSHFHVKVSTKLIELRSVANQNYIRKFGKF